jgi:cysteinyl-tRNA synthetase
VAAWAADPGPAGAPEAAAGYERRFWAAVDDDLDTAKALAVLAEMEGDEGLPAAARRRAALAFDRVLGLDLDRATGEELPPGAEGLIARREAARAARDWAAADRLRDDLAALGVEVSDTRGGTSWRLLPGPR